MLFDVAILEIHSIQFDEFFAPGKLNFSGGDWKLEGKLHAVGAAEFLKPAELRTVWVHGTVEAEVKSICARCMEPISTRVEDKLDLCYCPMNMITNRDGNSTAPSQTGGGFYEEPGPVLSEVLQEQLMLSLPMRSLCDEKCRGICTQCGINLNQESCTCAGVFVDSRWEALRKLQFETEH